jgi:hypothetical protein
MFIFVFLGFTVMQTTTTRCSQEACQEAGVTLLSLQTSLTALVAQIKKQNGQADCLMVEQRPFQFDHSINQLIDNQQIIQNAQLAMLAGQLTLTRYHVTPEPRKE